MFTLEPFTQTEEEYQLMSEIEGAVFDMPPFPPEVMAHDDKTRRPGYPFQRDWIRQDGQSIAYAEWGQRPSSFDPQKYDVRIYVDPAHDNAGVRPFYFRHLLNQLADREVVGITSGMVESRLEAMRFFEAYEFHEVAREAISTLDLKEWDAEALQHLLRNLRQQGIRIATLRTLQEEDPRWQERLFELEMAISRDVPSTGQKQLPTFDAWQAARLHGPAFDPQGWFVALDGDQYVGESEGFVTDTEPASLENGLTGVLRPYRRRGIASALKVHLLRYAQERGALSVVTTNDSKNPMYQLNLKLGFEPQPAWVRVEKTL